MAEPLFYDDLAALQARLRLSAVPDATDAIAIIEDAVEQVHAGIVMRLGLTRLTELTDLFDIMTTPMPTAEEEILMTICKVLESTWVRLILMDRLPMLWMDQSGGDREVYNQEGAFRGMSPMTLRDTIHRFKQQIEDWLNFLAGSEADIDIAWTSERPCPLPGLGQSLYRRHTGEAEDVRPGEFDGNFIDMAIDGEQ